ncbi:general transcription factor 3C polypeptide 3 [Centruroides vittatus]|uniref:general transcription factor 3C polypeptide 3 n=1 Tax=Centruroides vittatus TaxID=120091 RepID=UPI00350EB676
MDDNEAGPSNIFRSLLGEISEEQWETYKEIKREQSNLVLSDSEYDSSDNEANDGNVSPWHQSDIEMELDEAIIENKLDKNEGDSDECDENETQSTRKIASELTVKYINGEMTFSEITDILQKSEERDSVAENEKNCGSQFCNNHSINIMCFAFCLLENEPKQSKETDLDLDDDLTHKKRRRRKKLPKDLEGLMGAANLAYARGFHDDAIKMCMEIIKFEPSAPEPFQTLSMLYEDMGDMEKSFQFSLIGAYLNPSDSDEWNKLAEMALEQGKIKDAITYYSHAIKYDPENIHYLWERCKLYEQLGERKKALIGYEAILKQLKPEQEQQYVQLSRETTKQYHEIGDVSSAIHVMEQAFNKCSSLITSEDVNFLLELQISQQKYLDAINILRNHCGVSLISKTTNKEVSLEDGLQDVEYCNVPDVLPIDLQIKLVVCLIHTKGLHLVPALTEPLKQENPEEVGDLYLDIAEAYMQAKEYAHAIPILSLLVNSQNYNMAAVWLRYGECLNAVNEKEKATEVYKKVVEMAPCHIGARFSLSNLLKQSGKTQEAIIALKQCYEEGQKDVAIDLQLLMERCNLLYLQKSWKEYIECGMLVLSSHFFPVHKPSEYFAIAFNQSHKRRIECLKEIRQAEDSSEIPPEPKFTESKITPEEMWELYLNVWQKLYELGKYKELQECAMKACTSSIFFKMNKSKETDFLAFLACYYNRCPKYAYCFIKDLVTKHINNNKLWNLYSQIVIMNKDTRHNRFCLRLLWKNQDHVPLQFLNGHSAMIAGTYKHALGEYMPILKTTPEDPYVMFCIGLTFVHLACQKFAEKRHSLVIQSCAFLMRYYELRGECQESLYNLGRAMHQLGLNSVALHFYKKALACPLPISSDNQDIFDLRHEIAYNMCLIYQASGATALAQMYLRRYCII